MVLEKLFQIINLYPNNIAVEENDKEYTYKDLYTYSLKIASKLKRLGIKDNDVISIEIKRGFKYIALMIAIWLLKASFAALEDIYPSERLDYIAKDCNAKLRIKNDFFKDIEKYEILDKYDFPKPSDDCLLIYTSGSTGKPKGVIHTHESINDAVERIAYGIGLSDLKHISEKFLEAVPFSFVAGITIVFFTICYGVTVSVSETDTIRDPNTLANYIYDNKINMAYIPPKVLKIFKEKGNSLHTVITGSEKVSCLYRDDFKVYNSYGSSETGGGLTFFLIDKKYDNTPIGKIYSKEKFYILDDNLKEVPEGELCIAGNFARGYLNYEEATKKTFIDNPFKNKDGFNTLLRSGDIVKLDNNGNIIYLNRKDWMIKINGQRIEPGEIETAIRNIKSISDAVIKNFTDPSGHTYICAYYVLKNNLKITTDEIKIELKNKLPNYMISSYFIALDKLPVNSNGKLDRNALEAPKIKKNEYVAARNDIEKEICLAFEKILEIKSVGIDDDFFYLGGDSIKVMLLINNIKSINLSTNNIYEARTPRKLALYKENKIKTRKNILKTIVPLTQSQIGIYLACIKNEKEAIYNNPTLLCFSNDIDILKLSNAINKVVLAHKSLFAKIINNDIPSMVYNDDYTKDNIVSISNMTEDEFNKSKHLLLKPFDILNDRLFRFNIIKTEKNVYLFIDIHHIIFDGFSMQVLFDEIIKAFTGLDIENEEYTAFDYALDELDIRKNNESSKKWYLDLFGDVEEVSIPEGDLNNNDVSFGLKKIKLNISIKKLDDFCKENNTTKNVVLTAAFGKLLSAYTMKKKSSFATIYNGRHNSKTNRTISMFVKTLPVLCSNDSNLSVNEYLDILKEQIMGAMVNDSFSFIDLCNNTGYSSDILFTYQGKLFEFEKNDILKCRLLPFNYNQTGEKLSIQVYELNNELIFNVQYHANRYSQSFIEEFVNRYDIVLNNLLNNKRMSDVDLVTNNEKEEILKISYGGDLIYDFSKTFIDLFKESVNKYPNKIAVKDKNSSYTYNELNLTSNKIAAYLIKNNTDNSCFVGIKLSRIKEFISAIIGIQKAGLAYIPIDPDYPSERIEYMIKDSMTNIVLDEALITKILKESDDFDINLALVDKPAYMIYTSGSTGKPKGVVILHKSLVNAIMWRKKAYGLTKDSINASHASFSFDASIDDIFPVLSFGGEVDILDEVTRKDLDLIYDYFVKNKITGVTMSTQIGMSLINAHPDLKLNYMVMGGEKLLPTKKTNIKLFNGYGPTEFTVCSSYHLVKDGEDNIPIGKAVPNTYSLICDANGNLLPLGMVGELCLAGIQISKGYFNREELNKERFVYNSAIGEKMYRTGDLARYNESYELEYIGRIDFQVKLRGFRIELGEIENRAASYDGILAAAAEVKNNLLVLYYTSSKNIDENDLKKYLSNTLTDYMVPTIYMKLDEMPLTPNGKINRKALPDVSRDNKNNIKPTNDNEQKVYDILVNILKFDDFGIKDDFNYIGLTSLTAMQFVSKLSKEFGKKLRMIDLDTYNNIELLSNYLKGKDAKKSHTILKEYPLTLVQQGIISEVLAHPNTTIYNVPTIINLPNELDLDKLINSINIALDCHPYLKARIKTKNDEFVVIRDDNANINIDVIEKEINVNDLVKPFDILNDTLTRIAIIKTSTQNSLFIDAHHLIFDGESLDIFLNDISNAYSDKKLIKEEYTQYEYALDELKLLQSDELTKAKEFYNNLFEGRDLDCILVNDHIDKTLGKNEFNFEFNYDKKFVEKFVNDNNLTINSLWITALGVTISKYLNRKDAFFTTVYNGRNDINIEKSVGMFVKTLPIIVDTYKDNEAVILIKNVSNTLKKCMINDIYSFKDIAHDLSLRADIMFVYEGNIAQGFNIGDFKINDIKALAVNELKAPITIMVFESENGCYIHAEYDESRFMEWSIKSFVESLTIVFNRLSLNHNINDISLLTEKRIKELNEFNNTNSIIEKTDLITLFRKKVKEYPNNISVIYKDIKLTYKQLDLLTDIIAKNLVDRGIKKGKVVSILLSRNENMVIAPIAVMKTGAAYQPLDSSYPTERLEFMINDANSSLIIAEEELLNKIPNINIPNLLTNEFNNLNDLEIKLSHPSFNDLMILLYTSGTTGIPKGVMLSQGNLVNFVNWYHKYYDLKPSSVVAAYAGFGFDACMMDLYPALTNGSAVCIVGEDIRMNMNELEAYFKKNNVTHSFMTTQVGRLFAEEIPNSVINHLSVGGEKLTPLKLPNTFKLYNGYGPTECTIFSTIKLVNKDYLRIPIGSALDNYKLYVVDEFNHELPVGALGELWISGYGVGIGYLNQEEKTKSTFIDNPFNSEEGFNRVYKTGDIVRRLPDGGIDFIGRNDGQVKIRGFRIELSEVELVIRSYPKIKDVTVQAFETETSGKFLAAYFTSDEKISIESLKDHIKKEKPAYMVPASLMQIDEIPLNQNQKVNKKALPKPVLVQDTNEYVPPKNDLEKEICNLYQDIIGIDKVSANDSFFDIGGTSLAAAKVVVYMMNHNYNVSYQDVFAYPKAIELADFILNNKPIEKEEIINTCNEDETLKYNSIEYINDIKIERELGKVLLTGATGFLGIHVFKELIDNNIQIYALVRGGKVSAFNRLKGLLMYYFDSPMDEEIDKYVKVIDSDITNDNLVNLLKDFKIDTIINCAAIVKHFSSDDSIERVNVLGVKNLLQVAKAKKARFIQVSTLSVAGENVNNKFSDDFKMKENQLYFGQDLSNKYVNSKFKAEEAILNEVKNGLDAKIIRVGNLMSRQKDGEFQINNITNSFIRSLRSYKALGMCPISMLDNKVDFSPIDETAKAILLFGKTPKKFSVFHCFNSHQVEMGDVIDALNQVGIEIKKVSDEVFRTKMKEFMLDVKKSTLVSSLLSYSTSDNMKHSFIQANEDFSIKALYRLGYHWPITDFNYLKKAFESLITLGFFDREDLD